MTKKPIPSNQGPADDYYASLASDGAIAPVENSETPKKLKIKAKIVVAPTTVTAAAPVEAAAPTKAVRREDAVPEIKATIVKKASETPAPRPVQKVVPTPAPIRVVPAPIVVPEPPKKVFVEMPESPLKAVLVRRDGPSTIQTVRPQGPRPQWGSNGPRSTPQQNAGPRPVTLGQRLDDQKKRGGGGRDRGGKGRDRYSSENAQEKENSFRRGKSQHGEKRTEKDASEVKQVLTDKSGQTIELPDILSVKEFSEKVGIALPKIITELMKNGMMVSLNSKIDFDTCYLLSDALGVKVIRAQTTDVSVETLMTGSVQDLLKEDDASVLVSRPPIVSIMGHVDHGKTSILDYIRKAEVAKWEAGGITQRIGAYQVERQGKKITFLDTPGHEAFTLMRARGARLTDLAIIVIAADEGMKPQTLESISHAKQAGVQMLVAVNKMDKPGANIEMIKGQLAEQGLTPEDWGGSTIIVPVSAHTGLGIEKLLEMILLSTEMLELKANPARSGVATVIEAHLDPQIGPIATVLINGGTLKKTDAIVCAGAYGRVRFLRDYRGKNVDHADPGMPVLVAGLGSVVEGGDILRAVESSEIASAQAHEFELARSRKSVKDFEGASLASMISRLKAGSLKQLKIVLKSDSGGSLEALKAALSKLSTAETNVQIIHAGVGDVNEGDVLMAGTSQALLVGYSVGVNPSARQRLVESKIEHIDKKVIYHILERVEEIITGMVDLKHEEVELGRARIKALFYAGKDKLIVGCEVIEGKLENRAKLRIVRGDKSAGKGEISNLRSGATDVREISAGECGISFKWNVKLEVGDILEAYKLEQRK